MKRQLSASFVCLACRKVFKQHARQWVSDGYEAVTHQPVCPQCRAILLKIGDTFRAPRQANAAAWRVVHREILKGRRFERDEAYPAKPRSAPRLRADKGLFSLFQLPARKRKSHAASA